ncbi:hypothetical protein GGTG_13240 [Gaeumannomyces tritici R3-111a-1]|uniref:Nephrocystin 3-like N-terminal domain-containing protein n=1 Tax=Gaeumannomyces tritici (strain R3-111a-1) TaxID=644352 RepID=J3PIB2_GAET3|nr:hypothetical protein GGTG_13240 [Gaeumannomyces tritici R3-111a-1]EJT69131.1 hypothetical protein GGTG_13240 [Gaeumannomyces tritici R3-111a-1]
MSTLRGTPAFTSGTTSRPPSTITAGVNGNACLAALRTTDPRHNKARIEGDKGGLLDDVYQWVLGNHELLQWRQGDQNRLLWIKKDPGKGKTMLLCSIINELEIKGGPCPISSVRQRTSGETSLMAARGHQAHSTEEVGGGSGGPRRIEVGGGVGGKRPICTEGPVPPPCPMTHGTATSGACVQSRAHFQHVGGSGTREVP